MLINWSEFSECDVTCGGGVRTRTRSCMNGRVGQAGCTDATTDTLVCNVQVEKKFLKIVVK